MNTNNTTTLLNQEPSILSANTYFWSSANDAGSRRRNEARQREAVAAYLTACGFEVSGHGDTVAATGHGLEIAFSYSESCKNVYKHLSIYRANGKKSNITALRKVVAAL